MGSFKDMSAAASVGQSQLFLRRRLGRWVLNIAPDERVFVYKDRQLKEILGPGRHVQSDILSKLRYVLESISTARSVEIKQRYTFVANKTIVDPHLQWVEVNENQCGIIYKHGMVIDLLKPGTEVALWRSANDYRVELIDLPAHLLLDDQLAKLISRQSARKFSGIVESVVIEDGYVGLLYVDGRLQAELNAGVHAYWSYANRVEIKVVDLKLQAIDVQGQEILTKDKVSIRINLIAAFNIADAVKVEQSVDKVHDYIYRELQLALRSSVGTQRLDDLLSNKNALNDDILTVVQNKATDVGVWIDSVGVKDVILPGDMKVILNQVVEAEKAAQANVIKRREETAATRSLLNTVKIMEENPLVLRLKELEALEKVVSNVDSLNVYQGLQGVMENLVNIANKP